MTKSQQEITNKIIQSRNYKGLYEFSVTRIVDDCVRRYGEKRAEKEAKRILHQIWGVFYPKRPDFAKLLEDVKTKLAEGYKPQDIADDLLLLHSSSVERVTILGEFYRQIFSVTGIPDVIVDQACGLNPLTVVSHPELREESRLKYYAYDIDVEEVNFLNKFFKLAGLSDQVKVEAGDVYENPSKFPEADVTFLFKLLPLLQHQSKDSALYILRRQNSRFVVVTFPTASVSGREKGMPKFYSEKFKDLIKNENWKITELNFPSELVFVVEK